MKTLSIILVLLALSPLLWANLSLGISPSTQTLSNVLKGTTVQETVSVSATDNLSTVTVQISATGPIKDWISFSQQQVAIKSGTAQTIEFNITPPSNTADGVYNGTITASVLPSSGNGGGSQMGLASAVTSSLSVGVTGQQVLGLFVSGASGEDIEQGQQETISMTARDTGNTEVTPSVELDVFNASGLVLSSRENAAPLPLSAAGETLTVAFPTQNLPSGNYSANVSVFLTATNNTPVSTKTVAFNVVPAGTLGLSGKLMSLTASASTVSAPAKVIAVFGNTGKGGMTAQLKGDITINGTLVSTLQSDPTFVPAGQSVTLTAYYTPTQPGLYNVSGYVQYSTLQSNEMEAVFRVAQPVAAPPVVAPAPVQPTATTQPPLMFWVVVVVVVIVAIGAWWYFKQTKKPQAKKPKKK